MKERETDKEKIILDNVLRRIQKNQRTRGGFYVTAHCECRCQIANIHCFAAIRRREYGLQ